MKKLIKNLSKLANRLDSKGHYKLADDVDRLIQKYSEEEDSLSKFKDLGEKEVEVPEDELDYLKEVFKDLDTSLKKDDDSE